MGGIRVLDEALHRKPGLKVVMISAYGNCAVKSRAKELCALEFFDDGPPDLEEERKKLEILRSFCHNRIEKELNRK